MKPAGYILPVIVVAQFCCTSLWFAGNAVLPDLVGAFGLSVNDLGHLTSAVQFGFISGTLVFAILTIADRFPPSRVFLVSALAGGLCNLGVVLESQTLSSLLAYRFATGFFLAGIYPVGMKIAADYYEQKLGKSLGFLVGALVLGTAFPHLIRGLGSGMPWRYVIGATSLLAALGGILLWVLVPNGPFRKAGGGTDFSGFLRIFGNRRFRAAAFGYFGHMWELYAFWAFVPLLLNAYLEQHPGVGTSVPITSFAVIGIGGLGCVLGGYISQKAGTQNTAFAALLLSGLCCLALPLAAGLGWPLFLLFLLFWGVVVIADSPLFSTLVARRAHPELKGTALTIVNCVGFSITIASIQLMGVLFRIWGGFIPFMFLALGPVLGLLALASDRKTPAS
ncbi:nitrate/nitrite transporter [Robiginitalea sp. SC105]|uniref:MFS transporter n=1 Tax=Robiginitalea sp. SC105 TaxID=2762332 RepID=UPI00351C7D48